MSTARAARRSPLFRSGMRIGLLGLLLGTAWLILSLFSGGSSASADTGDEQDSLLGSVISDVVQTTYATAHTVTAPVEPAVQTVKPVAQAVKPVAQAVQPVAQSVTQAAPSAAIAPVDDAVHALPAAAAATVDTTVQVVADVRLSAVTEPVTDLVDGLVSDATEDVPVVGDVVQDLLGTEPTAQLIGPVVDEVDAVVDIIDQARVPAGVTPALPGAPADGAAAPSGETSAPTTSDFSDSPASGPSGHISAHDSAAADRALGSPSPAASVLPVPGPASNGSAPGGASTGGGASGASTISDAVSSAFLHGAAASLVLGAVHDELPSSPVFGTDSTPD